MKALTADTLETIKNRERLKQNHNLLFWYKKLFEHQFGHAQIFPGQGKHILEIGSGTSPLKMFYPEIFTSDIMNLDYLDFQFDAHEIDQVTVLGDKRFDLILMTNVLHHLRDPLLFLQRASLRLRPGGKIIFTEPFYSVLSTPIYKLLHHEPSNFKIDYPRLTEVAGPLSTANMAMPQMIFFEREDWLQNLSEAYDLSSLSKSYFTGLAYFATGGISRNLPFPKFLYPIALKMDQTLAWLFPKLWASFSTIVLTRHS